MTEIIPFDAYGKTWTEVFAQLAINLEKSKYKPVEVCEFSVDSTTKTITITSVLEMSVYNSL
jgi:hypothetical protein